MESNSKFAVVVFIIGLVMLIGAFGAGILIKQPVTESAPVKQEASVHNENARSAQGNPVQQPDEPRASGYLVRVATLGTLEQADRLTAELRRKYLSAHTHRPAAGSGDSLYRVDIGPYIDREAAEQVAGELTADGRKGVTVVPVK